MAKTKTKTKIDGDKQPYSKSRTRGLKPRWKPGQSGNPKGRPPKALCLTSEIKEYLDQVPKVLPNNQPNKEKKTWCKILAEEAVHQAAKGNHQILKELFDRTEGKVRDKLEVETFTLSDFIKRTLGGKQ